MSQNPTTYGQLQDLRRAVETAAQARTDRDFAAAGGCPRCNGWGMVCIWSTMDGWSSYDEFGPCPEPGCRAELTGKRPGSVEPGTSFNRNRVPLVFTREESDLVLEIDTELARLAKLEKEIEESKKVKKGSQVEVVRGRKTPIGTVGHVFWIGPNKYGKGNRLGINTAAGETVWIAEENVEVML